MSIAKLLKEKSEDMEFYEVMDEAELLSTDTEQCWDREMTIYSFNDGSRLSMDSNFDICVLLD